MSQTAPTKNISILLLLHQPYRVNRVDQITNIDELKGAHIGPDHIKDGISMTNESVFNKVAKNAYLPTGKLLLDLLKERDDVILNFSFSGTFLQQAQEYPEYGTPVLELWKQIAALPNVAVTSEVYYHSLAYFVGSNEFGRQVNLHQDAMKRIFGVQPSIFRHTENMFNTDIANQLRYLGFKGMSSPDITLTHGGTEVEGLGNIAKKLLDDSTAKTLLDANRFEHIHREFTVMPTSKPAARAFFFIDQLDTHEANIIQEMSTDREYFMLFNDFEGLGEHTTDQEEVARNLRKLFDLYESCGARYISVDEASELHRTQKYDVIDPMSTATIKQDIHVWRGNYQQETAFQELLKLYNLILEVPESYQYIDVLWDSFGKFSTSDNFYYLNDDPGPEGEFQKIFLPYPDRQEAYEAYMETIKKAQAFVATIR